MCDGALFSYYGELVRALFTDPAATLPVRLRNGFVERIPWGRREKQRGGLPLGGWARLDTVQAGHWNRWEPRPVRLPIVSFMARDTRRQERWYDLKPSEWIQGLLAHFDDEYRVYVITIDPSILIPEAAELTHTRWPRIMHT